MPIKTGILPAGSTLTVDCSIGETATISYQDGDIGVVDNGQTKTTERTIGTFANDVAYSINYTGWPKVFTTAAGGSTTTISLPLPDPATLVPGTTVVVTTPYGKNAATVVNGAFRYTMPFVTTWVGRPPASYVPVGTELQVTDYANQKWVSDGANWRPAQGHAVLLNKWGSVTAPLAIVTGASDMQFSLPVSLIKAELIIPDGVLTAIAWVRRTGANGTAYVNTRLGTLNSYADAALSNQSLSATDALSARISAMATPGLTSLSSLSSISPNGTGTSAVVSSSNFNLASDMNFSIHIRTANAADSFSLIGYQLIQEV